MTDTRTCGDCGHAYSAGLMQEVTLAREVRILCQRCTKRRGPTPLYSSLMGEVFNR